MSKLTKFAKGQECTLRLPGCSPGPDNETVVCCHLPSSRKGMGIKSEDWCSIHACASCHDILDGRRNLKTMTRLEVAFEAQRAFIETIRLRVAKGLIKV